MRNLFKNLFGRLPDRKRISEVGMFIIQAEANQAARNAECSHLNRLEDMRNRPQHYKKFDAENGWGTYDVFVPWIQDYLDACIQYPHAIIEISR